LDALLPVFFVLSRYCQTHPNDAAALHLLALVCERLGHHDHGAELVERSISVLEAVYEETEDPEVEMKYTIANCTLARLNLSLGKFMEAATLFESAYSLLADKNGDGGAHDRRLVILKVQVHLGLGLANYLQGNLEAALGLLEEGLEIAKDDLPLRSQVVILLTQILWRIGTEDAKDAAKSRLLEW
jgi:superkiller protein 3